MSEAKLNVISVFLYANMLTSQIEVSKSKKTPRCSTHAGPLLKSDIKRFINRE